jgi:hypothetical protein
MFGGRCRRLANDINGVFARRAMRGPIRRFAITLLVLFEGGIASVFAQPRPKDSRPDDGAKMTNIDMSQRREGPKTVKQIVREDPKLTKARDKVKRAEGEMAKVALGAYTGAETDRQRSLALRELEEARAERDALIVELARTLTRSSRDAYDAYRWNMRELEEAKINAPGASREYDLEEIRVGRQQLGQVFRQAILPEIEMIEKAIIELDAEAAGTKPTQTGLRPPSGNTTGFHLDGSFASVAVPQQSYLGSFNPITGQERVGLFQTNHRVTMTGGSVSFEQNFAASHQAASAAPINAFFAYGAFFAANGSASGNGTFDPGVGNRTLLPGPLGGPSGVSLGGYPANIVTGIVYRNAYETAGGMAGFGYRFPVSPVVRISAGGHVGFQRSETSEHFAGAVTGLGRDFAYDTSFTTNTVTFGAKAQVDWMVLPALRTFVKGHAGVGLVTGSGNDALVFTGLPTSTAVLSTDRNQAVGGVSAGFEFLLPTAGQRPTIGIGAEAGFERMPGFAIVVRDGTDPSQLQPTGADAIFGKAKLGVLF